MGRSLLPTKDIFVFLILLSSLFLVGCVSEKSEFVMSKDKFEAVKRAEAAEAAGNKNDSNTATGPEKAIQQQESHAVQNPNKEIIAAVQEGTFDQTNFSNDNKLIAAIEVATTSSEQSDSQSESTTTNELLSADSQNNQNPAIDDSLTVDAILNSEEEINDMILAEDEGDLNDPNKIDGTQEFMTDEVKELISDENQDFMPEGTQDLALNETTDLTSDETHNLATDETQDLATDEIQDLTSDETQGPITDETQDLTTDETQGLTTDETQGLTTDETQGLTTDETQGIVNDESRIVTPDENQSTSNDTQITIVDETDPTIDDNQNEDLPSSDFMVPLCHFEDGYDIDVTLTLSEAETMLRNNDSDYLGRCVETIEDQAEIAEASSTEDHGHSGSISGYRGEIDLTQCEDSLDKPKINQRKVCICHIPSGNSNARHTLLLPTNAVKAHLRHHNDALGRCSDLGL